MNTDLHSNCLFLHYCLLYFWVFLLISLIIVFFFCENFSFVKIHIPYYSRVKKFGAIILTFGSLENKNASFANNIFNQQIKSFRSFFFILTKNKVCLSSATNCGIKIRKNSNTFQEIILFHLNIKKINYRIQSEDGYFVISETENCTKVPTRLNNFVQIFWTFFCMLKISSDSYKIIVHKKNPVKNDCQKLFLNYLFLKLIINSNFLQWRGISCQNMVNIWVASSRVGWILKNKENL